MDALQNIIKFIEKDTNEKINALKEKNDAECQKIISDAKNIAKKECEKNELNIARKKEQIISQTETSNAIYKNKFILEKKHKLIDKALSMAMTYFHTIDSKKYFTFFSRLIEKNLPDDEFKLVVGSEDFDRIPDNFLANIYTNNNMKIEYEKSVKFTYGFKIVSPKAVIDFSLKSIFADNIDMLKSVAYSALNLGEVE